MFRVILLKQIYPFEKKNQNVFSFKIFLKIKMNKSVLSPISDKTVTSKMNKIVLLREQRKEAISKHEFSQAQEIDKEIAQIKQDVIEYQERIILLDFEQKIRKHVEVFNVAYDKLKSNFDEQVHMVRVRYNKFFIDTQISQKTELLNAEREYKDSISRENLRRIPECENMLELSRKAATNGQYDEARSLKEKACDVAKANLEKRIQMVDEEFLEKRKKLLLQFEEVLTQLESKFNFDLITIEKKKKQAVEKEKENRSSQIQSTYSKTKLKLVQSGASKDSIEASKLLVKNLREILGELGCPIPKGIGADIPSSGPGSPHPSHSFRSESVEDE